MNNNQISLEFTVCILNFNKFHDNEYFTMTDYFIDIESQSYGVVNRLLMRNSFNWI